MSPLSSTAYWHIVRNCLTRFFKMDERSSLEVVGRFRRAILKSPLEMPVELIYHQEPLLLASRLHSSEEFEITPAIRAAYELLVEECTLEASALGTDDEVRRSPLKVPRTGAKKTKSPEKRVANRAR
jgi:hypothetical protein